MKRLFIAIEVSKSVKQIVSNYKDSLSGRISKARWVPLENIHLSLRFLGDCQDEKIPDMIEAIRGSLKRCQTFHCRTTNLGVFPNPRRAGVLWLGVADDPKLTKAYDEINKALASLGFDIEKRPFMPHITLARMKRPGPVDINIAGSRIELESEFIVDGVTLFESHLSSKGAMHEVVSKIKFKGIA